MPPVKCNLFFIRLLFNKSPHSCDRLVKCVVWLHFYWHHFDIFGLRNFISKALMLSYAHTEIEPNCSFLSFFVRPVQAKESLSILRTKKKRCSNEKKRLIFCVLKNDRLQLKNDSFNVSSIHLRIRSKLFGKYGYILATFSRNHCKFQ